MTYSIDETEYIHQTSSWLFPASHEALIGRPRNQIERWAADIVLADIVRYLLEFSFTLNEYWAQKALEKGQIALDQLREENILFTTDRKFLDLGQPDTTIFGRELAEEDNICYFTSMRNFGGAMS